MEEIKLDVIVRSDIGTQKVKKMRRDGYVPAVVYGGKRKPTTVMVEASAFQRIMRQHRGESVVFHLNVMEGDKKLRDYSALVKQEQLDPVTDELLHIDFNRISLSEKIEVKVPFVAKGEAIGVKKDHGSLDHVLWELDVVCLPRQIPRHIEIDVSELGIHDAIHVKDIELPEGVITKHDPEAIIVTVVPPMKEVEEEPAEAGEETEPEVIKEKKDKEEGSADSKSEGQKEEA